MSSEKEHAQEKTLVSSKVIMEKFGYTDRASFSQFVKREDLPRYQLGDRKVLFNISEIDDWLKKRHIGGEVGQ